MSEPAKLDKKQLRTFGLMTGGIVAGLFGLLFPWIFGAAYPYWPWVVAVVLAVWSLALPASLDPVYRRWMKLGEVLSRITTPVILGIVFYAVFTPVGLVMRLVRHDPMKRPLDTQLESYRTPSRKVPKENVERPY